MDDANREDDELIPPLLGIMYPGRPLYECGATILSTLTFPAACEAEQRVSNYRALCGYALSKKMEEGTWELTPEQLRQGYLRQTLAQQKRALATTEQVLEDRLMAGRSAMRYAKQAFDLLPVDSRPSSLGSLQDGADAILQAYGNLPDSPHPAEERVRRESEPVLHIACALCVIAEIGRLGGKSLDIDAFLTVPFVVRTTVNLSNQYADLLLKSEALNLESHRLIRLLPFADGQLLAAFEL